MCNLPPAIDVMKGYEYNLPKISNVHVIEALLGLNKPLTSHVSRHSPFLYRLETSNFHRMLFLISNGLETSELQSFTSFCIEYKERLSTTNIIKIICLRKLLKLSYTINKCISGSFSYFQKQMSASFAKSYVISYGKVSFLLYFCIWIERTLPKTYLEKEEALCLSCSLRT